MSTRYVALGVVGMGLAVFVGPCGSMSPSGLASSGGGVITAGPQLLQEQKKCDVIAKEHVVLKEERAVGGSLAVRMVSEGGGLLLKAPGTDVDALKDPLKVSIPKTPVAELNRYVNEVGRIVAAQSSRPELAWTFAVLDSPGVNAFSTPGGYVMISKGLLAQVQSEAQLAALLGHEIAHVTERHHLNAYQKHKVDVCNSVMAYHVAQAAGLSPTQLAANAIPLPSEAIGPLFSAFSGAGLNLDSADGPVMKLLIDGFADGLLGTGFAQQQEFEADQIGLELATRAGYADGEYEKLLEKLPPGTGFFAKHPPPKERASSLVAWKKAMPADSFDRAMLSGATVVLPHPKELKSVQAK